jgi:hypothetical protein
VNLITHGMQKIWETILNNPRCRKMPRAIFGNPEQLKTQGKSIWAFTNNGKLIEIIDLAFDDRGETFQGEFESRKICKNVYMVPWLLMNAQTILTFDIHVVYDFWAKIKHLAKLRTFPMNQNEIRNPH